MRKKPLPALSVLFLLSALVALSGCQSVSAFFVGQKVDPNLTIPLPEDTVKAGTWQTFDIAITYSARPSANNLEISGSAKLSQHYQQMYDKVKRLEIYLFFLNRDLEVLRTVELTTSLFASTYQQIDFSRTLPRPAGTEAISFGYRGEAIARDGYQYFDELP